jgi:hypothetical protein
MASRPRILQVVEVLPERATHAERIATLDADVREAAASARKRLEDHSVRYHNTGWTIDEQGWEMAVLPNHMILVSCRLVREH